jgi:RNase P subunit RPR2
MHVAPEQLPSKTESVACPKCGTELVITRITPVLFVGEFEYLTLACKTCGATKELTIKRS